MNHIIRALDIESLPKDIPEKVEVQMGEVELNEMIRVSELSLDGSLTILNDPNDVVVNVHLEKIKEETVEVEEGEEGAEGETPAEGAAPAEGEAKAEEKSEDKK